MIKTNRTLLTIGQSMINNNENKRYIVNKDMLQPIIRTNLLHEKPKTNAALKRRPLKMKVNNDENR